MNAPTATFFNLLPGDGSNLPLVQVADCPLTLAMERLPTWTSVGSLRIFHRSLEVIAALRRHGVKNLPPLEPHYAYPGVERPMHHQVETVEELQVYQRCAVLNGLGTGKTLAAIWAADILQKRGVVNRVLVITPKSTMFKVWLAALFQALPRTDAAVMSGDRQRRLAIAADTSISWLITNPEGLTLLGKTLPPGVDLVIVDEATKFKNFSAVRTRWLATATKPPCRLWLMTATPTPQSPEDAYALIRLIRGNFMSKTRFKHLTMQQVSEFRWVPRPAAAEIVAEYLTPAVRFRREDCFDLPPFNTIHLEVDMSPTQKALVAQLEKEAIATLSQKLEVTAANAAAVLSKTFQVMTGGVYTTDEDGDRVAVSVDASPLFDALDDIIEAAETPVLIYTPFRISVALIARALTDRGRRIGCITGGVLDKERMSTFDAFQTHELDAIVAVPSTISHGITLTESNVVVWTVPTFSAETDEQANARIYRYGQTRPCTCYRIVMSKLALAFYRRLESHASLQATILNYIEGGKK